METGKIVAIHQPNFFPWLGYFDKIVKSDIFILLDNVQFPKTGGIWTNRVKIMVGKTADWITVPIIRSYHGLKLVSEIEINDTTLWRKKMLATIESNYKKTKYFQQIYPVIVPVLENNISNLYRLNINILKTLTNLLGIPWRKCILAASLKIQTKGTDMLVDLTRAVGGEIYLCGGGTNGYQDDNKFSQAGIKLIYQKYKEPIYPQRGTSDHVYGLSIIDTLMNCGVETTKNLLRK